MSGLPPSTDARTMDGHVMNGIQDRQAGPGGRRTAVRAVLSLFIGVALAGAAVSPAQALVVSTLEDGTFSSWYLSPGSTGGMVSDEAGRPWLATDSDPLAAALDGAADWKRVSQGVTDSGT